MPKKVFSNDNQTVWELTQLEVEKILRQALDCSDGRVTLVNTDHNTYKFIHDYPDRVVKILDEPPHGVGKKVTLSKGGKY